MATKYIAVQRIESPDVSLWPGDDVPDDLPGIEEMAAYAKEHPENAAFVDRKVWEKSQEFTPEE